MERFRANVFGDPTLESPFVPRICHNYGLFKALEEARRREGLTIYDALAYTMAVKDLFQDEQEKYAEFCQIMKDYRTKRFDVEGLKSRIKTLFKGNEIFILGFNVFLPDDCSEINPSPESDSLKIERPRDSMEARYFLDSIRGRLQGDCYMRNSFLNVLNLYRKGGFTVEGVFQEIEFLFEDDAQLMKPFRKFCHKNSITSSPMQCASPRHNSSLQHENQRSSQEMHENKRQKTSDNEHSSEEGSCEDPVAIFCQKVKERVDDAGYQQFLKVLHDFVTKRKSTTALYSLLDQLLGPSSDMMEEFHEFVKHLDNKKDAAFMWSGGNAANPLDTHHTDEHKNNYKKKSEIRQLDLSSNGCCTDSYSYCRLPENTSHQPSTSRRTDLEFEVLNDQYKAKGSKSSWMNKHKNIHAEILIEGEENRADMDVLIETAKSTLKGIEEHLAMIRNKPQKAYKPALMDHLSVNYIRCIERLYGEHGLDIVNRLQGDDQLHVLPIILQRLKQKIEEWSSYGLDFNKNWTRVQVENYQKSLDHSNCSCSKQGGNNTLRREALLSENEGRRHEEDNTADNN